jgi:hypothetical protein
MKVRNGFVSNSSTSSFCIYGIAIERDHFLRALTEEAKKGLNLGGEGDEDEDGEQWYEVREAFETTDFQTQFGIHLEVQGPYDSDYIYIGRSYDGIGDNETGGQFKQSIRDDVAKVLAGLDAKEFCTQEEAWHD